MRGPRSSGLPPSQRPSLTAVLLAGCGGSATRLGRPRRRRRQRPASTTAAPATDRPTVPSVAATLAPTPVPSDGSTAGQERTDAFGIAQVWVPAGTFTMGTDAKAIAALEAQSPPTGSRPSSRASNRPTR